jgi:diguanylate cyclase (GGDEF)-like protein/PAS domain S-box-containing protein
MLPVPSIVARVRRALPVGQTLPRAAWERRHHWMLVSLWVQMAGLEVYATLRGYGLGHAALHAGPLLAAAIGAGSPRFGQRTRSALCAMGMFIAAAVAVHTSGGAIEAHFYFFVVIVVLALYEDWVPFLLAIGFVVLHHGILGMLDPSGVYAPGTPGAASPWKSALVHGAFVSAAGVAAVIGWRLNEDVRLAAGRSQEQFQRSFEDAPIGMALCSSDGRWLAVNRSLATMLGYTQDELVGRAFLDFTHPDDAQVSLASLGMSSEVQHYTFEKRYVHRDGRTIWAALHISRLNSPDGLDAQLIAQMEDVTDRRLAEAESETRTAQQQSLLALGRHALAGASLKPLFDEATSILAAQTSIAQAKLLEVGRLDDEPPRVVSRAGGPPDDPALSAAEYAALALAEDSATAAEVLVTIADHGDAMFGVLSVLAEEGHALSEQDAGFVGAVGHVLSGAVQRLRSEDELRHQSLHDSLVDLPNRVLFLDRLERALARTRRSADCVAVIFIDLDRFKNINDSLGHDAGDVLLRSLAPRLRAALRDNDTLARFGGDEFVVLCEELSDSTQALNVAQRLRNALDAPFRLGDQEHVVSASIGVAVSSDKYQGHPDELVRDADAAMYRAKASGRNRIELFDEVLRARIVHRLETEAGLRGAIERDELRLYYQPIVDIETHAVLRCEALVRWQHPERGLVPPDEFIPVAEETGLIIPLGTWVVEEACRQMAAWSADPESGLADLSVSVNLSALQVVQEGLAPMIAEVLRRYDVAPRRLVCEITETSLIENPEVAEQTLLALQELGVSVALDDFGTGYSSLASLKRFALAAIKLDRSFIKEMTPGSRDAAIIGSLVTMADSLGLGVVAEGVETEHQRRQLQDMGCEVAQGYLFGRPVPAADFAATMPPLRAVS